MIKVSGYYPNLEGKMFDIDYYCDKHLALAKELLGDSLKKVDVEKGLAGGTPDSPAIYVAVGSLYFESIESFQNAFIPVAEKLMADVPNYTNIEPIIQISEVRL